jgi:hypothetical protein
MQLKAKKVEGKNNWNAVEGFSPARHRSRLLLLLASACTGGCAQRATRLGVVTKLHPEPISKF